MKNPLARFYEFLDRPIAGWSRIALAVLVFPLLLSFAFPLWKISLHAPQYPKGLYMEIYSHKLDGGNNGHDINEINELNHYIGMHKIDEDELAELSWMPFAIIALALLAWRCAAIGNVRMLIDLAVISAFIGGFSMARFVYRMYYYGHHLDPTAAITVPGFTPALFGTKQIANFSTSAYPQVGSYLIGVFLFGVAGITVAHLWLGRRAAAKVSAMAPA